MAGVHYLDRAPVLLRQQVALAHKQLSGANLKYALDFADWLKANGRKDLTIARRIREVRWILKNLRADARSAEKKDVEALVLKIANNGMAQSSREKLKITTKLFFKYLSGGDDVPALAKWIRPKTVDNTKTVEDMLNDQEVEELLRACRTPRDKAVISILATFGCRVGELLNLKYKDLSMADDKGVYWISFNGKTGLRRVPYTNRSLCYPYLIEYLDTYKPANPEAPLFTTKDGRPLDYTHIRKQLRNLKKWTGIRKRLHSHVFRFVVASAMVNKGMPEALIKRYMGWSATSKELGRTYAKLSDQNLASAILSMSGIAKEEIKAEKRESVRVCQACGAVNPISSSFCSKCRKVLDAGSPLGRMQEMDDLHRQITRLTKIVDGLYTALPEKDRREIERVES